MVDSSDGRGRLMPGTWDCNEGISPCTFSPLSSTPDRLCRRRQATIIGFISQYFLLQNIRFTLLSSSVVALLLILAVLTLSRLGRPAVSERFIHQHIRSVYTHREGHLKKKNN
jgi:hypothetical protein